MLNEEDKVLVRMINQKDRNRFFKFEYWYFFSYNIIKKNFINYYFQDSLY